MILRKVWGSVWSRSNSGKDSGSQRAIQAPFLSSSSLGPFDQLPVDILEQILMLMEPRDAARFSIACKACKCLAGDNRLWIFYLRCSQEPWESIFFAETSLCSGYPLRMISSQSGELSFMPIYGQRAKVPGSIIIDGGSGYCQYGWSKYASPSGRSATFLEFGNIESPIYARLQQFFATIFTRMQVKPSMQPIVVSLSLCRFDDTESAKASKRQLKTAILNVLFDMSVPAVCAVNQAILALYAARRTSGIVINIGFQVITILPILHGKVMCQVGVEVIGFGALKLTGFLKEKMQENNIKFQSLYIVRTLKEKLCYVALDYKAELSKDTQASVEVSGEGWFTLSKECFQTGEILFQPHLAGMRAMSLHQAVALCMDHCDAAGLTGDGSWYKTVVLARGSAYYRALEKELGERLEKELHDDLPSSISNGVRVIPPPCGVDTAWHGAKLISNCLTQFSLSGALYNCISSNNYSQLSTFPGPWCITKKQFHRKTRLMW